MCAEINHHRLHLTDRHVTWPHIALLLAVATTAHLHELNFSQLCGINGNQKQSHISHLMMISAHFAAVNHWIYVRKHSWEWPALTHYKLVFLYEYDIFCCGVVLRALCVCWSLQEHETCLDHDWWGSLWRTGTVWITYCWGKTLQPLQPRQTHPARLTHNTK